VSASRGFTLVKSPVWQPENYPPALSAFQKIVTIDEFFQHYGAG